MANDCQRGAHQLHGFGSCTFSTPNSTDSTAERSIVG